MNQLFSLVIFTALQLVIFCSDISTEVEKSCRETLVSCPCGNSSSNFTTTLEICFPAGVNSSLDSEVDLLRIRRFCAKFKNCETCKSGSHQCFSCPNGKSGDSCSEDAFSPTKWMTSRRISKRSLCAIPEFMHTNTYHCYEIIREHRVVCVIRCEKNHKLPEGRTVNITCDRHFGIWYPHGFRECQYSKFDDCAEKNMIETGEKTRDEKPPSRKKRDTARFCEAPTTTNSTSVECRENNNEIKCDQTCKDGYVFDDGTTRRSMKCSQLTGLWKPKEFKECKERRTVKRSLMCAVPTHMETNTFECNETNRITTCHQTCNEGYTFREGPTRTITCKRFVGYWRPHDFQQCIKKRNRRDTHVYSTAAFENFDV